MRENVSPPYVIEIKTDVTKQTRKASPIPCSDLSRNKSLQFSIASIVRPI